MQPLDPAQLAREGSHSTCRNDAEVEAFGPAIPRLCAPAGRAVAWQ